MNNQQKFGVHALHSPTRHVMTRWVTDELDDQYRLHLFLTAREVETAFSLGAHEDIFQIRLEASYNPLGPVYEELDDQQQASFTNMMVRTFFPELVPYLMWAGFNSSGFDVDAVMTALSERDDQGLLEGERKSLYRDGTPVWELVAHNEDGSTLRSDVTRSCFDPPDMIDIDTFGGIEDRSFALSWEPVFVTGVGKAIDFDAARRLAYWPTATDAELMSRTVENTLIHRQQDVVIPAFKIAMSDLGLDLYPHF